MHACRTSSLCPRSYSCPMTVSSFRLFSFRRAACCRLMACALFLSYRRLSARSPILPGLRTLSCRPLVAYCRLPLCRTLLFCCPLQLFLLHLACRPLPLYCPLPACRCLPAFSVQLPSSASFPPYHCHHDPYIRTPVFLSYTAALLRAKTQISPKIPPRNPAACSCPVTNYPFP